jgi:hypothetical protein
MINFLDSKGTTLMIFTGWNYPIIQLSIQELNNGILMVSIRRQVVLKLQVSTVEPRVVTTSVNTTTPWRRPHFVLSRIFCCIFHFKILTNTTTCYSDCDHCFDCPKHQLGHWYPWNNGDSVTSTNRPSMKHDSNEFPCRDQAPMTKCSNHITYHKLKPW